MEMAPIGARALRVEAGTKALEAMRRSGLRTSAELSAKARSPRESRANAEIERSVGFDLLRCVGRSDTSPWR